MKKVSLIAETAWHHDGNFNFMKDLVKKIITQTKTDYIKLHLSFDFNEYMTKNHPAYGFFENKLLSENQWTEIINKIQQSEKKIMLLLNDKKAIDFGIQYNPDLVEIHSVCLNDIKLLHHLKNKIDQKTKIVLGVGGSTLYEIENAINTLQNNNIVLMHGFQNYPTKYEDINFRKIMKIISLFPNFEHGYADHTAWNNENNVLITLLGAVLGMDYIEKHITTELGQERTDWQAAINIDTFNELQSKLEILNACSGNGLLELNIGEKKYSVFGPNKKAGILNKNIKSGSVITENDIDFKRTKKITDLSQIDLINSFGRKVQKDFSKGYCLQKTDIEL
ncbi:MAG: N-acetylneuraminate synthase family protein [Bacteroidales bacterium]|nr:N-acetylneuraminate synthase family protein [Bacteroidales bacterium]